MKKKNKKKKWPGVLMKLKGQFGSKLSQTHLSKKSIKKKKQNISTCRVALHIMNFQINH